MNVSSHAKFLIEMRFCYKNIEIFKEMDGVRNYEREYFFRSLIFGYKYILLNL